MNAEHNGPIFIIIYYYAYAESSSKAHITTKGTKIQKLNYVFCLCVLRGENHIRHIKLEFPNKHVID